MKQLIILAAALLSVIGLQAQPWISGDGNQPQKLEDIKAAYERNRPETAGEEEKFPDNDEIRKEGKDYHFGRWIWYWERHLDENGYMVSPVKTFEEWAKYRHNTARGKTRAKTSADESDWTFEGPSSSPGGYNGVGRISVVAFHPTDVNTFIVGAAGGGAWRTTDGGLSWTSLYSDLPVLGVSDIDYNPLNPNTIYLCTGDRDASDTYSVGLMKSTDGGATWDTTGLKFSVTNLKLLNALVINPLDTNSLIAATSAGLLKSFDGGATWIGVAGGNFKEVVYNPADTNIVYAANKAGGSNIFRSSNGGMTWQQVTSFTSNSTRIALAVTPADPSIVKAVIVNSSNGLAGIYNSTDTGHTFTNIFGSNSDCSTNILNGSNNLGASSCDGQGWYDLCIAINPVNPDQVLVGGVNTYQSLNGGASWNIVTQWAGGLPGIKVVHADKHFLSFHPLDPSVLFEGNDGGIYKTSNPASTLWTDLSNGLGITQFYRNAVADAAAFVIGGAQDNGTKRLTAGASGELTGGDGMDCQIDYSNPGTFYTSSQYGSLKRTVNNGANYTNISNNIPGQPDGAWITPFIVHPFDPNIIIAGYDHVFMSYNQGTSWTDISPNFPTSGYQMKRVAMSPGGQDRLYVQYGNTSIRYTDDYGNNWSIVSSPPGGTMSDIQVDPKDAQHLWVSFSGYGATRVAEYRSGVGWTQRNDSLPNLPVQCLVIDSSNGTIYLGTDVGVFYRDTGMHKWELYNNGLPVIEVDDLGINYATNEIWAATYGRGMWKSPRHLTQAPAGISNIPYAADVITISPNPNNGRFSISTTNKALVGQYVGVRIMGYNGTMAMETAGTFGTDGRLSVSGQDLARGSYIVEVMKNGQLFARNKMVVL